LPALLQQHGIVTLVDVRLRPERAHMGLFARAKTPEKGIQGLLAPHRIAYVSLVELGNVFIEHEDWAERYRRYFERVGDVLLEPLATLTSPWCLMCAERDARTCHRQYIAAYLEQQGMHMTHLA
jgi:uncharacterized protein (DUF488 family)